MRCDLKIRKVKTPSNATAVQIMRYQNGGREIIQHIGSAHTDEQLEALLLKARKYVHDHTIQPSLFPLNPES
ncbi:hypothetical protein [Orrella sp. 11846]|uniref:hypothetical protein n=1 Tax=Orrella sp. 11846 TaxID=3409913 RepID=UPI003B59B1F3